MFLTYIEVILLKTNKTFKLPTIFCALNSMIHSYSQLLELTKWLIQLKKERQITKWGLVITHNPRH